MARREKHEAETKHHDSGSSERDLSVFRPIGRALCHRVADRKAQPRTLFGIQLNNEMLIHRKCDVLPLRFSFDSS